MKAQTVPRKEGLPPFKCIYGRPFLHTDIVIDPEALELTNYLTQLSTFQKAFMELWEVTPDPASESNKPLFKPGTKVLIKKHWDLGASLSGKALTRLFFLLSQLSKCQELIRGYITLELRGGTLTRTKWLLFMSLLSMLWLCTFQMGLIIYVSLLLPTPKILSLPFDLQDNAFLSWAHSYAAFHNPSNCWVCGALPSSSVEGFPWWTSPLQKTTFSKSADTSNSNHMWCLFFIWWHLTTLKWTGATLSTLTLDIMWLLILIIHCLGLMTILLHIRQIGLDLMVFYLTLIKYGMRLYG